ncbi:MAG: hypothetical protein GY856_30820 [bacterium]|nr:hypothetical protein [bacterium]
MVEPTVTSCSRCGAPQPQSVPCPNCGRTSRAGDRFCGTCGQALGEATAVLPAAPEPSPTARWRQRPAWILALALGALLLVLGLGLWWFLRSAAPAVPGAAGDGTPPAAGAEPPAATVSPPAPAAGTGGGVTEDLWSDSTPVGGPEAESGLRDYTDREKIHRIAGRWMVEISGGGWATVQFTETMTREVQESNIHINYYDASSRTFPPYYTIVRLPDGGNFLAFQHPDGEYGDVFENVAFHDANTFSFTRGGIRKRFFAYRTTAAGVVSRREAPSVPRTREERSTAADGSAGEETAAPGPASEAVETPAPPTTDAAAIPPPETRSARQLWEDARRLKEDQHFHSLVAVLDALLDADPYHEKAREWRSRCAKWIREQEEKETERARDFIDELVEAISDHDLDDVFELWDERPDAATRSYFQNLFGRYRVLHARGTIQSIRVRDATASFTAEIVIEGKTTKGRSIPFVLVAEHRWHGQLRDRRFAGSFP